MVSSALDGESHEPWSGPEMLTARRKPKGVIGRALGLVAATLTEHELPITIFLAFLTLFPNPGSWLALVAIPLLWTLRWTQHRHLTVWTPVDMPLLVTLIMLLVTFYATAVFSLTWVALCQLLASIALFYALVNRLRSGKDLLTFGKELVLIGAGLAILAPLSTDWVMDKVTSLGNGAGIANLCRGKELGSGSRSFNRRKCGCLSINVASLFTRCDQS